jgi:cob(I)alamin adenosyltransferase
MKIYTKTGDKGQTGLVDGSRVSKSHVRIQAVGTLDEANAFLGWLATELPESPEKKLLFDVQSLLFNCGARLAEPSETSNLPSRLASKNDIKKLEQSIDGMTKKLPPLNQFILPGGTEAACRTQIARSVIRRAEREIIALKDAGIRVEEEIIQFVNRLSDWLFTLARYLNHQADQKDIIWAK